MELVTCVALFLLVCGMYVFLRRVLMTKTIDSFGERYILITGCDSGFGYEACIRFCDMGFPIFAGCFTEDAVKHFTNYTKGPGNIIPFKLDVTSEDSIREAGAFVRRRLPHDKGLWALINNAGISGATVPVLWQTRDNYEQCLRVNLLGPIDVVREFFLLLHKEKGRVINMTSMMGRIALPSISPYNASKYGLEAVSDCLRREVKKFGVTVHIIEPGFFTTNLTSDYNRLTASIRKSFEETRPDIQTLYGQESITRANRRMMKLLDRCSTRTDRVMDAYIHAVTSTRPQTRYVVGWDARTVFRLLWNLPTSIADKAIELF